MKESPGPGGSEDERVDVIAAGSMRRIEGGLTTLSVTNDIIRTLISRTEYLLMRVLEGPRQDSRIIQVLKKRKNRDVMLSIRG